MKLIGFAVLSLISSGLLFAQTTTNTSTTVMPSHELSNWEKNLKVRYFGEYLGSSVKKWDDNQINSEGERTGTPANLWNLWNFQYKVLPSTTFLVSPRYTLQVGDRNELRRNEDPHVWVWDDLQVGFMQDVYRTNTFMYGLRLSHRHPVSTASKNAQIKSQVEFQQDFTWLPTSAITIVLWNNYRYYAYDEQKNERRHRINFTTLYNYAFNDKWKTQLFHDFDLQHQAPKRGNSNKKDWNYLEKYKNQFALGVGYTPNRYVSVMPFVKALDDENVRWETMQMGLWLFGNLYN